MRETLGHYRLLREIGRGAMGEVYLAEDTKLGRQVALKLLPSEVADNAERLARFAREAKAAATINHPGVVTLHSIEETQDDAGKTVHFLTMELVDGQPLSASIKAGGSSVAELLDWGVQLSDAVAAAHAEGITHRDLKPANIMLTRSGRIKVLDFGLARAETTLLGNAGETDSPTAASVLTREGRVLGTPAYMSPEQAEGMAVDHRSDIFSLGVVLYELASGQRPFRGSSPTSVLSAILRDQPAALTKLRPELPTEVERIIRRCLAKQVDQRFQSALDVRNELEDLRRELATGDSSQSQLPERTSSRDKRPLTIAILALALGGIALTLGLARWRGAALETPVAEEQRGAVHAELAKPRRLTTLLGRELFPNLSSDGKNIVFAAEASGNWDIYLQRVGGTKPISLTADHDGEDTMPALSPDDQLIAFRSARDGGGLFVMGATGESVRRISTFGYNPSWSPDGSKVVFASKQTLMFPEYLGGSELWVVDVVGGDPRRLHGAVGVAPAWSPNGHRIAFVTIRPNRNRDVMTIPANGGEPTSVTDSSDYNVSPHWSTDGRYLYYSDTRGFLRVAIDEQSGRVLGEPKPVTATLGTRAAHLSTAGGVGVWSVLSQRASIDATRLNPQTHAVLVPHESLLRDTIGLKVFDVSPDGTTLLATADSFPSLLFTMRTDGTERRQLAEGVLAFPRWSPDGERIALVWKQQENYELYTMRRDGSDLTALTNDPEGAAGHPVWSPDGRQLVYWNDRLGRAYSVDPEAAAGTQPRGEEVPGSEGLAPTDWSADGSQLLGQHIRGGVVILDLATGEQRPLTASGHEPRWLGVDAVVYEDHQKLHRFDLETGAVTSLVVPDHGTSIHSVAIGEGVVYHVCFDSQVAIWTGTLE